MEKTTLLKIGFEIAVILNVLSIITWILLAIFPGLYYFSIGEIGTGFQVVFLNIWFYMFVVSIGTVFFLQPYVEKRNEEKNDS